MFKDKETANRISKIMLNVSEMLDESAALIEATDCSADEKAAYYKTVGQLMGIIGIDVLNNIYRIHADIKPEEYLLPEDFKKES